MTLGTLIGSKLGKRKLGWWPRRGLPDPRDVLFYPGRKLVGAKVAFGDEMTLKNFCPPMFDQGYSGSCVLQTIKGGVETIEREQGLAEVPTAVRPPYYLARRKDDLHRQDAGCYSDTAFKVWNKYGAPPEHAFPWNLARMNQPPPATTILLGDQRRGLRYEYIRGSVTQRHQLVDEALREGLPVYAAGMVGNAFRAYRGGVLDTAEYRPDGGHAFLIVGRAMDGITPLKQIRNSWGVDWGMEGYGWVGPRFFADIMELVVVHGWKRSARARDMMAAAQGGA